MSVRYGLGATSRRVTRQLLIEGLVLGLAGGFCGVAIAPVLAAGLISFVNPSATNAGMTSRLHGFP